MKNMFEILQDTLQEGMEIKNEKELSNKWKFSIIYNGMQAATELPKTVAPGCESDVCKTAINNAMSTMYINEGNLAEAKSWLDGDKWNSVDEKIEYQRVNNEKMEELIDMLITIIIEDTIDNYENKKDWYDQLKERLCYTDREMSKYCGVSYSEKEGIIF